MNKKLTLVIGDKHLSSWSMRPWLLMKASGLPFKEIGILLDKPDSAEQIKKHSPSGKVPLLTIGTTKIWDSLAISETIAELAPDKNLWPTDLVARAKARSYCAEMHSSFQNLRTDLSMNLQLKTRVNHLTAGTKADIKRVMKLWEDALAESGGPYLFGKHFGIVDAFYAPVVFRFKSYGIGIKTTAAQNYIKTISGNAHVKEWVNAALREDPTLVTF
ncbi:MAG: glutathione S-transferase family protein [Bdellovibrionota bacterium]